MSARSRALIPLSAEQQAAMQAVAVTEQRRRQGRTLSAWPYATAFFRCLNGSRRISLTDLRFFAPALTKEEFHGNRLLWLAAVDKLIESFGEVCVLPLPSDAGHRLFPSVPFREGERRRQKTTLQLLYRKGLLRTEIPGGFSPQEAQALLDNLVRSHISRALSGE